MSYLTDYIEKELFLEPCSYPSVMALNDVLNLKRLGFHKIDKNQVNEKDVLSLYMVENYYLKKVNIIRNILNGIEKELLLVK